ncbi:hypothetical protein ACFC09_17300 [Streptomyces sp. NPDC056161]|uniref:hypothetical protein n=1 Tax=Streptomyces sp. NPDC056161 TaxID=3345732 RepID=UPI0035D6647F
MLAQCTSTAVPSFRGREVPLEGDAVGVGCELPPLSPVPVPESYESLLGEPLDELPCGSLRCEPPPPDVELSWSWLELLQPPPSLLSWLLFPWPRPDENPVRASTTIADTAVNLSLRPRMYMPPLYPRASHGSRRGQAEQL